MTRRRLALVAANLVALAVVVVLVLTWPDDGEEPVAPDTSMALTVTGTTQPGWEDGRVVLVADDGTGYLLDGPAAAEAASRPGERVTVAGRPGTPVAGAEDVPVLTAATLTGAGGRVSAPSPDLLPDRLPRVVRVPAAADATLRVDGRPAGSVQDGEFVWDTGSVRDGVHLVGVVPTGGDRPVRHDWVEVAHGGGPPATLPGREIGRGDFETGDLSQWDVVQSVGRRGLRTVREPVREGRYAVRVEVRQGDDPIDSVGNRNEVSLDSAESEGQERWYSWSTMAAPDFPDTDEWQVLSQWHSDADGPPPVALYAQGDRLVLQVNRHDAPGEPLSTEFPWSGPLLRGRWRDIVFRVRWSGDDARGLLQLWVDGVEVLPETRIRTMYPGYGNYFKQGYYRNEAITEPGVVYHDGLVVTQTSP